MRVQYLDKTGTISWHPATIKEACRIIKRISAKQQYWHKSTIRVAIMQGNDVLMYWEK